MALGPNSYLLFVVSHPHYLSLCLSLCSVTPLKFTELNLKSLKEKLLQLDLGFVSELYV